MLRKIDRDLLAKLFRSYIDANGCSLHAGGMPGGFGRVVIIAPGRQLICDCLVQPGRKNEMVLSMLDRAFGGGEPMIHRFKDIGLGGIASLEELTLKLAAAVPARSRI